MPAYYDNRNYDPPMPMSEIKLSGIKISMILDTGADMSLIPKFIVTQLESALGQRLPYSAQKIEDFNGAKFQERAYKLEFLCQIDNFKNTNTVKFVTTNESEGILGRDVLNFYSLCFNGPALLWSGNCGED